MGELIADLRCRGLRRSRLRLAPADTSARARHEMERRSSLLYGGARDTTTHDCQAGFVGRGPPRHVWAGETEDLQSAWQRRRLRPDRSSSPPLASRASAITSTTGTRRPLSSWRGSTEYAWAKTSWWLRLATTCSSHAAHPTPITTLAQHPPESSPSSVHRTACNCSLSSERSPEPASTRRSSPKFTHVTQPAWRPRCRTGSPKPPGGAGRPVDRPTAPATHSGRAAP